MSRLASTSSLLENIETFIKRRSAKAIKIVGCDHDKFPSATTLLALIA